MKITDRTSFGACAVAVLMAGTMLSAPAEAQRRGSRERPSGEAQGSTTATPTAQAAAAAADAQYTPPPAAADARAIKSLRVEGSQRVEPETVLSYTKLRVGERYNNELLDQAIKDLLASALFADVTITGAESGDLVIRIRENPIINRVLLEGNKNLKADKITKEIKLAPRQIFTRPAVRQDVARIVELYRRQGRFAAAVVPKMINLDQNRVDVVFEITEGPKSKVRAINIIGNHVFGAAKLRQQFATKTSSLRHALSSNTSYDQDRLAYDQQKLRQFYLTNGYADFRVTSAIAELTPDKRDFIITYVVDEGKRYKFGDVTVDSDIRDFDNTKLAATLPIKKGEWYDASKVEKSVDQLSQAAGLFGYAFTDVNPEFQRDPETLTMGMNFHIAEAKRTYVERVEITGNRLTQDKVIRREIRLGEGDAFNSFQVKRSNDRLNSLGYFQDKLEIKQTQGSSPDRVVLNTNVEEKATGQLSLSAGYSSIEKFLIQAGITQSNFRGKGQELRLNGDYSTYNKSVVLGFTEPYLFNKPIALGVDIFRRDLNSFNLVGDTRQTTYSATSTGFTVRTGVPLTEYWTFAPRYSLTFDNITLDQNTYYTDGVCDPLKAGRYLCDSLGKRTTSAIGYSFLYDSLDSRLRPTRGRRLSFGQDFAGVGGDVKYIRSTVNAAQYFNLGKGWVASANVEGGYIKALNTSTGPGVDPIRINDRFYLGEPQFRGFDIRGVGPRVVRQYYTGDPTDGSQALVTDRNQRVDDALGGRAYYLTRFELQPPLPSGLRELGLRPSFFVDVGAVFGVTRPRPTANFPQATDANGKPLFNKDGSPTLLPIVAAQSTVINGKQVPLYQVPTSDTTNGGLLTTCATGYASAYGGSCAGDLANTAYTLTTQPFYEQFLGNTPKPRVSIGFGVNWNSPFGPLRIDLAKALVTAPGDDKKLITFNVGTQF